MGRPLRAIPVTAVDDAWSRQAAPLEAATWPTLHLDDLSGIPFTEGIVGIGRYQLRARIRARTGDVVAATCSPMPAYEAYNRDRLGLGTPHFVHVGALGAAHALAASCHHGSACSQLVDFAIGAGRLLIHPYMGTPEVWSLAAALERRSGVPVRVLAPSPPVTTLANDKWWIARLVRRLIGPDAVPECEGTSHPSRMAEVLRDLATRHARVALKRVDAASAMGMEVFDAAEIDADAEGRVLHFLRHNGWTEGDTILATAWVPEVTASPSCQVWVPPTGSIRVDGVYEQVLTEGKMFVGSVPSSLPTSIQRLIGFQSRIVAGALRWLGYQGRCSFDFVVSGGNVTFVECNGRWGGTSTPMHLMDRLFPDGRPPYQAMDMVSPSLVGASFRDLADHIGHALYDPHTGRGRFILYNVTCLREFGKFDVIALGPPDQAATSLDRLQRSLR